LVDQFVGRKRSVLVFGLVLYRRHGGLYEGAYAWLRLSVLLYSRIARGNGRAKRCTGRCFGP
jgi:hypothetical protein